MPDFLIDDALVDAVRRRASDLHVEPLGDGYELRLRVDGLLEPVRRLPADAGRAAVGRLMVLAGLLTYRPDVPQEGRLDLPGGEGNGVTEARVSTMPTARGLRAVVRLPAELVQPRALGQLGLPDDVAEGLRAFADADAGMLLVVGPAGSGKTTTLYALLEFIATRQQGLSIVTLEDPVERRLEGVTQIEVTPFGGLTYEVALRSILRQDPQVLMLGEVRDAASARLAVQAALSGHRLLATLHAADPAGAVARLIELGVEPHGITGTLFGVLALRLLRRRAGEGYAGRVPAAVLMRATDAVRAAVRAGGDAAAVRAAAGVPPLADVARDLAAAGVTDEAEVTRVFGGGGG